MPKNDLALRLRAHFNAGLDVGEELGLQLMADMVTLALHAEFGFGADRLERLMCAVEKLHARYYKHVTTTKDPECDFYRQELDTLLAECVPPERYAPFEKRYPKIKEVQY